MFDLGIYWRLLPKDVHGFFNFQLETCWSRVEDFKTISWTKGAAIFRASQVLEDVRMFVRGKMFTNASSKVSIGFTNITGTTACTRKLVNDSHRKLAGMGSLAPNQLLILNGVTTNLISRSLHNMWTTFLILRCVMMEKGPMYRTSYARRAPMDTGIVAEWATLVK